MGARQTPKRLSMLESLRSRGYRALTSSVLDRLFPVRFTRSALCYLNDVTGRPLAPSAELEKRAVLEARIAAAKRDGSLAKEVDKRRIDREQAPVVIFHRGRATRDVRAMCEILDSAHVTYQVRNIEEDEPTQEAVRRESQGFGLPVVFVAGEPIGRAQQLARLQAAGLLRVKVLGD